MGAARPARNRQQLAVANVDRHHLAESPVYARVARDEDAVALDDAEQGSVVRQLMQWLVIFAIVSVPILGAKWWNLRQDAAIARLVSTPSVAAALAPVAASTADHVAAAPRLDGSAASTPVTPATGVEVVPARPDTALPEGSQATQPITLEPDVKVVRAPAEVPYPDRVRDVAPVVSDNAVVRRGIAVLSLLIDPEGNVVEVELLRSIDRVLDAAALTAARQWKFAPTIHDGKPVAVRSNFTVPFGY